jgi:hypothetical protein
MADLKSYLGSADPTRTYRATTKIMLSKVQLGTLRFLTAEANKLIVECTFEKEGVAGLLSTLGSKGAEANLDSAVKATLKKEGDLLSIEVNDTFTYFTCEEKTGEVVLRPEDDWYPKITVTPRDESTVLKHSGGNMVFKLLGDATLSPM